MKQPLSPKAYVSNDTSASKSGSCHEPKHHVNDDDVFLANRLTELSIEDKNVQNAIFEQIFQRDTAEDERQSQPFKPIEIIISSDESVPTPIPIQPNSHPGFIQSVKINSQEGAMKVSINRQSLQEYANRIDRNKPVSSKKAYNFSKSDPNPSGGVINVSMTRNTYLDFMEDQASGSHLSQISILDNESVYLSPDDIELSLDKIPISNLESKLYKFFQWVFTDADADCSECPL